MTPPPANTFAPRRNALILPGTEITPEWAWSGATGRGVKVAILDSGVEGDHPGIGRGVQGYISIREVAGSPGEFHYDASPHSDSFGHGTACAGIIRALAPECDIYSVKVLGFGLVGRGSVFAAGLRWAIDNGMDICNLSLGTTKRDYFGALRELADEAYFKNILLVTAANNLPAPSAPSIYSSVISVAAHDEDSPERFYVNPSPPVDVSAHGIDVRVPWVDGEWITTTGNSFAAPHITGLLTRLRGKYPGLRPPHIKVVLEALAANSAPAEQIRKENGVVIGNKQDEAAS
jgi:subtilisin